MADCGYKWIFANNVQVWQNIVQLYTMSKCGYTMYSCTQCLIVVMQCTVAKNVWLYRLQLHTISECSYTVCSCTQCPSVAIQLHTMSKCGYSVAHNVWVWLYREHNVKDWPQPLSQWKDNCLYKMCSALWQESLYLYGNNTSAATLRYFQLDTAFVDWDLNRAEIWNIQISTIVIL